MLYASTLLRYRHIFTGILLFFLFQISFAKVIQSPVFKWIIPQTVNIDGTIPTDEIKDGCFYLLSDNQSNLITKQFYSHFAYKLVSEMGVQNNSEIQIVYNPAYQKFYLHGLKIHRNGKTIDCRNTVKIKEIQREEDLEWHIYDETQTIYIILNDVRPGDIIEYDYSIEGLNPIFEKKFQDSFYFNFDYTLLNFFYRIIKSNSPLFVKYYKNNFKPAVKKISAGEEWIWESKNNKPVKYETNAPGWYNQYPFIELSDYNSWEEVEKWGVDVFENSEPLCKPLIAEIEKIKKKYTNKTEMALAAVRFVQRQIRYLGIEIGINSHKPTSPNKVYQQRYGDCKDKTLLLCKMLKALNIEAYPALISTTLTRTLPDHLPSPNIFNHAVVKTILYGNEYWFDPTISRQEGDLNNYYFPNFQFGLVLDGKFKGLDSIPPHIKSEINIQENIQIHDLNGYASLHVTTTYNGCEADEMRYSVAKNGLKEIQDNFLDYYKTIYDSISLLDNTTLKNDTIKNILTISENYRIKDFWDKDSSALKSTIYSYQINDKLKVYNSLNGSRKSPIYLEYPLNINHNFIVQFPEEWSVEKINRNIKNNFFEFTSDTRYENKTCFINYHFQTFTGFVPAEKSKEFIKNIKLINDKYNGMAFTYNFNAKENTGSANVATIFFFIVLCGIFTGLSMHFYKMKPKYYFQEAEEYMKPHNPIGGWMVLPLIGLFLTPVLAIYNITSDNLLNNATWNTFTNSSEGENLYSILYLLLNFVFETAYIVFPILLIVLFFKRDKRLPKLMIYFYALNLVFSLFNYILSNQIPIITDDIRHNLMTGLVRAMVACGIWGPYFYYSYRVKETFVK
jgi:transglutaminase-like putative cysteine protease